MGDMPFLFRCAVFCHIKENVNSVLKIIFAISAITCKYQ